MQIHFNLLEDKHSFGYFWTPKSTYDICSVFLYMLSYTLSPKNSKIEILFCQTLRPECSAPQKPSYGPGSQRKRKCPIFYVHQKFHKSETRRVRCSARKSRVYKSGRPASLCLDLQVVFCNTIWLMAKLFEAGVTFQLFSIEKSMLFFLSFLKFSNLL